METWITRPQQLANLARTDRLRKVLIRYRGATEGRFVCAAQYALDMITMLEATDRYIRDISIQPQQVGV